MYRWGHHAAINRAALRAVTSFLEGRLGEKATVDWALQLRPDDELKRFGLLEVMNSPEGLQLKEPWRSAWRLIEEDWSSPFVESSSSIEAHRLYHRIRTGDRSGALVKAIVDLVAPRLKVAAFSSLQLQFRKPPHTPKRVQDLFSVGLTSGKLLDPAEMGLGDLADRTFLMSLASALENALTDGLNMSLRNALSETHDYWLLQAIHRVYYTRNAETTDFRNDPDRHGQGFAPTVKLLHEIVLRLIQVDLSAAIDFAEGWRSKRSPIYLRLWAALSLDSRVTHAKQIGIVLRSLGDRPFWDLRGYPEIAELRAKRFAELEANEQTALTRRMRKDPPRSFWPKRVGAAELRNWRLHSALRELKRINLAGTALPRHDEEWMAERIGGFNDLVNMRRLDEGFLEAPRAYSVSSDPDFRFDLLRGEERLRFLEGALKSGRRGWDDDPAEGASAWIRHPGNAYQVLLDLESTSDAGAAYENVWDRFGWTHSPPGEQGPTTTDRNLSDEYVRVLICVAKLPEATLRLAVDGISHWLSSWRKLVAPQPLALHVWLKIWPIAVTATNEKKPLEDDIQLHAVARSAGEIDSSHFDTLNSPAAKLIDVFLAACPPVKGTDRPFEVSNTPRTMRDAIISTIGRSRLIAVHRMIEFLPYFLQIDRDWTHTHLIAPLFADNAEALILWPAVAHQTRFGEVLKVIGNAMTERATDLRLNRQTRQSLVFSLVVDHLHAYLEGRHPAVPRSKIQQMIRSLDDEVRSFAAEVMQRFVRDVSAPPQDGSVPHSAEELFRSAVAPFLQEVWPQERSLTTPGISKALADLPAASNGEFAGAVSATERFLVPFDCWSMIDYGLYGEEDGKLRLSIVDNHDKAFALLRLLDRTVGSAEDSVVPHDLADALDQIRQVAPDLAVNQGFRRLATAARR